MTAEGCAIGALTVDCANRRGIPRSDVHRGVRIVGLFNGRDRSAISVAVTADGRRVQLPISDTGLLDGSLLDLLRSLVVGLESLLGLITGSRRENGGTRRIERE